MTDHKKHESKRKFTLDTITYSVLFYLFVMANDWISSSFHTPGVSEQNPFARGTDMQFLLWKGAVVDSFYFVGLTLIAYGLYLALRNWNKDIAKFSASALYIYMAADRLLDAVIPNYFYALHMYVPDQRADMIKALFGQ